jgi:hypothetical protein
MDGRSSGGRINHLPAPDRIREPAADVLAFLVSLRRQDDHVERIAEAGEGVSDAHARVADIARIILQHQQIDVTVGSHASGSR